MNQSFLLGYASKIIYSQSRFGIFIVFEIYCLNYKKNIMLCSEYKRMKLFYATALNTMLQNITDVHFRASLCLKGRL